VTVARPALTTRLAQGGILAAAIDVFARLGFAATRVEDILAAAGTSRRTFYKHFQSKEDVLAAVYEVATGELLRAMRAAESPDQGPLDGIRRALDVYLDYHVANAGLVRVLVEQAIRSESPLWPARRRFREDLVRALDAAVRATSGDEHDPMVYAALISALEGLSLDLLAAGPKRADVERAKLAIHLVLQRVLSPQGP
jgi:AcrR family transcriptional regulator